MPTAIFHVGTNLKIEGHQMQKMKLKHKRSLAVAMCRLIAAARSQKDVLLLGATDASANCAMQEYNDAHSGLESNSDYRRFLDSLAREFHIESSRGTVLFPSLPSGKQIEVADRLITLILDKEKHGSGRGTNSNSKADSPETDHRTSGHPRKNPRISRDRKRIP